MLTIKYPRRTSAGLPIIIVVTKSDRIDSVGDEMIQRGLMSGKGIGGGAKIKFCELNTSMSIKHNSELYGESHKRYHDRHGGKPLEDCAWDCGWHADWENDDEKEKEDDNDS